MNIKRRIHQIAKAQSESCLFCIVYDLKLGYLQMEKPWEDPNAFNSIGQTGGICECWTTIRDILLLLFPEEQWPDWRRILPLVAENLKHLPPGKPDWWYRRKLKAFLQQQGKTSTP